ncbi:type 1 glutamine amidotransferase domain-containing protein [Micromonospora sp. WMMA1363]|uniref:type 1 glutamine amidotransferase domain-containing protein n=1 Tax=Micromonospora sp. WMMA1363 TaxID=3053985 RepID=UPI00259CEC42|nr:type 1 glutamine amidotransferase domain-containing protein [Micromonospora sp. WMMA1363]MDM4718335.1 type 1 glutamine amidotransferase domain-containing protein [Micromonospora sp. WMMA1363]
MSKVLFVVTGAEYWELADGTKHPTGVWAEEVVVPHETFTSAGHEVVVATPGGVVPQVDKRSLLPEYTGGQEGAARMVEAVAGVEELRKPIRLEDVDLDDYAAVYYPGGHGPMEDLAVDQNSGRLLVTAMRTDKPLGIVCHGPAAMLAAVTEGGVNVFAGRRVTGFTNVEEAQAGFGDKARWLLQDRLVELGAQFQEGTAWAPNVVVDGNLVTGQNPASSAQAAVELLRKLA